MNVCDYRIPRKEINQFSMKTNPPQKTGWYLCFKYTPSDYLGWRFWDGETWTVGIANDDISLEVVDRLSRIKMELYLYEDQTKAWFWTDWKPQHYLS